MKPLQTPSANTAPISIHQYDWVLFDADDTLFRFDAFKGLTALFAGYQMEFTQDDYDRYQHKNLKLWQAYQAGELHSDQVKSKRFEHWSQRLGIDPMQLNQEFLDSMVLVTEPMPHALNLLNKLRPHVNLGIITNGFTHIQRARIERLGLQDCFKLLIISEQVGVTKPHIRIFHHALELMKHPQPSRALMVGDNPDTDIRGGQTAGFDTCWLNTEFKKAPNTISPTYQVASLLALDRLLLGNIQDALSPHTSGRRIQKPG